MSLQRLRSIAVAASLSLPAVAAPAQDAPRGRSGPPLSAEYKFSEVSGEALYANACQACHMADGKGAVGAGAYPSLAGDTALAASGYSVHVVVNGQRAMPPLGDLMSDDQIAAVVNYVRTHFGNAYTDAVTAADVNAVRR